MKKVYLQYWEESERGWGIRPDGCSLHLNLDEHKNYLNKIYKNRDFNSVPDIYERTSGDVIEVDISETLFNEINNGSLRLFEYEMNNLIKLEDLLIK